MGAPHKCTLKGNTARRKPDTTKKMSTTVIQYVLKYIQKYWLNVAKINSLEEKKQSQKKQQQQQQQKQKAWFSKPRTNYRDRSKLPKKNFVPHDILYHRISCYSFNLYFNLKQRVRS